MLYDDFTIFLYLKKLSQLNLEANTCDEYEEDFDDTFDGWETYRMNHSVRARINRRNLFLQLIALEGNVYVLDNSCTMYVCNDKVVTLNWHSLVPSTVLKIVLE